MTRMLKEFADTLDKRLPRAGGASAQRAERTPVDVAVAVTVLRCVALVIRLLDSFIGRFLPQARLCVCIHGMLGGFS